MPSKLRGFAAAAFGTLAVAGLVYSAAEILALRRFRDTAGKPVRSALPPMTIFKPLRGGEPQLYENLRSFCEQAYPQYQVIFGAADPTDPALEVARRLVREFPDVDLTVVAGSDERAARNPKIANVMGMFPHAKHDLLAIVDSDIRVGPEYLASLAAPFDDRAVGAATCLYAGIPLNGTVPAMSAAMLNGRFMPSIPVAMMIEPLTFCFGATMAVRRDVLETIGGLAALGAGIADDFTLGKLVADAGFRVALCPYVVRMTVAERDFGELWMHQLRWQRTVLSVRPAGFTGTIVTHVLPMAAVAALLCPSKAIGGLLIGAAAALRVMVHDEAGRALAPDLKLSPWLIPAADAFAFATWAAAFFAKDVTWRDRQFTVEMGGGFG